MSILNKNQVVSKSLNQIREEAEKQKIREQLEKRLKEANQENILNSSLDRDLLLHIYYNELLGITTWGPQDWWFGFDSSQVDPYGLSLPELKEYVVNELYKMKIRERLKEAAEKKRVQRITEQNKNRYRYQNKYYSNHCK